MNLSELIRAHADAVKAHPGMLRVFDELQRVALKAVYAESDRGGEARQVVADVAVALGVVLGDTGPVSVWDPANMRRVVAAAKALKEERDYWEAIADAEGADKVVGTMFRGTTVAYRANRARLEEAASENDDLRAVIVSQAREIARLKGENA